MFPFIFTILLITAIKCEEKKGEYFIPIGLRFDDSLYYNNTDQANYLFVDFQKLAIYNLCYSGSITVVPEKEPEQVILQFCADQSAIRVTDMKSMLFRNISLFDLSISNVDSEELSNDITLNTNDGIEILLKCNRTYYEQNKINLTRIQEEGDNKPIIYIVEGNTFFTCGILFSFQSIFYRYCGIFGYFLICFSFFNQVYGYNNRRFAFVFYGIFTLIRILGEVLDCMSLTLNALISQMYVLLIISCLSVIGMVFGFALSNNFIYKKIMLSVITGDVLFNFLFYFVLIQFTVIGDNLTKVIILIGCVLVMTLITFTFVKDEEKHEPLIIGAMTAGGSYFFLLGMKFLCGGFPFEHSLIQYNSLSDIYKKKENDLGFKNVDKVVFDRMKSMKNYLIYPILFVVWWLIGISFMLSSKKEKEYLARPIVTDDNRSSSTTEKD